jgi:hypothetical protein
MGFTAVLGVAMATNEASKNPKLRGRFRMLRTKCRTRCTGATEAQVRAVVMVLADDQQRYTAVKTILPVTTHMTLDTTTDPVRVV